jgi:hypothetical protein
MKAIRLSDGAAGLLALACAAVVVLGTALEAEARLGPAEPAPVVAAPPAPAADSR